MKWWWAFVAIGFGVPVVGQASSTEPPTGPVPRTEAAATPSAPKPMSGPIYRVELIIFRATQPLGPPEDWGSEASAAGVTPTPSPAEAASDGDQSESGLPNGSPSPVPVAPRSATTPRPSDSPSAASANPAERERVTLLPSADFALKDTAARLQTSNRFVVLAHAAWTQAASPWGHPINIPLSSLGLAPSGLSGTLALERGEFLHLSLQIEYTESDPPPGLDAPPGTIFVLDQVHRMRLNERDYFDHPAFGVIALVKRADKRPSTHRLKS